MCLGQQNNDVDSMEIIWSTIRQQEQNIFGFQNFPRIEREESAIYNGFRNGGTRMKVIKAGFGLDQYPNVKNNKHFNTHTHTSQTKRYSCL